MKKGGQNKKDIKIQIILTPLFSHNIYYFIHFKPIVLLFINGD
jgi:hypothetical protein